MSDASPVVLVAPDKFRGTLTAPEAAEAIAAGVARALPNARIRTLPIADGGEGTVDAVLAAGGEHRRARVTGPLGEPVDAVFALLGSVAVIEAAQACGLALVPAPSPDTALDATTTGVGELILAALDTGATRILVGLGGSATTDGGVGALRALGARTLDATGAEVAGGGRTLAAIATIDLAGLDPRLASVPLELASDVAAPVAGPAGAAHVFAAQKGADAAAIAALDAGLASFRAVLLAATGVDLDTAGPGSTPWGGAAGGLGGSLAAIGAAPRDGFSVIADLIGVDAALDGVELLIVGEGSIDRQSVLGKAPIALARRARHRGIRTTIAVTGRSDLAATELVGEGIAWVASASDWAGGDAASQADAARWVTEATARTIAGETPPPRRPSTVPTEPTPYFHFLRTPRNSWWRSLLLLVGLIVGYLIESTILVIGAIAVDLLTGTTTLESLQREALANSITITPSLFVANNISLALLIPLAYLLQWAFTRQRPRWLSSVAGRIRWRWLGVCLLVTLPIWVVYLGADALMSGGFGHRTPSATGWILFVAVLLTTPLQSMGEEVAFRGTITRAVASWIPLRWLGWAVGTAVSSVVFMFAHSAGDPWLNVFYLSFAIGMSVLAWQTGGLEAGIVIHAVNNTLALLPTVLFTDVSTVFDRGQGAANASVLVGVAVQVVVMVVLILLARRRRELRPGPPEAVAA